MPDISMCMNKECKLKDKCYRSTAVPSKFRQSYSMFKQNEDSSCDYFWSINNDRN